MDSHIISERLVYAQFGTLPWQLHRAVLSHLFALPEAKALVSQADQIAEEAFAATAALTDPANGSTAFQALTAGLLAPSGALAVALRNASAELTADRSRETQHRCLMYQFDTEKFTADCKTLLDALSNFQLGALRRIDLGNMKDLCQKAGQVNIDNYLAKRLVVILGNWARGMLAVLDEASDKYRIKLLQDTTEYERLKRSCYSNAQKYKYRNEDPDDEPDWAALYPLPPSLMKTDDWDYDEDDDQDEEAVGFKVTPRMAKYLSRTLHVLVHEKYYLFEYLPEVAEKYAEIEAWAENYEECAFRIAARLQKGLKPGDKLAHCTGEELILHLLAHHSDYGLLETIYDGGDLDDNLPKCKYDLCLKELVEIYTDDHSEQIMDLFDEALEGSVAGQLEKINIEPDAYQHPADWFKSFTCNYGKEAEILSFMDHHVSAADLDRTRLEERGQEVLLQSESLGSLPTSIISSVVKLLTDVDLMKLGLCTKC